MDKTEFNDWQKRTGHLTKNDLFNMSMLSDIRYYEEDLPDGLILDIGVGLGYETIYFAKKGRKVIAIDKEGYFLSRIKKNLEGQVKVLKSCMPYGILPNQKFALVILSNILQFLTFEESIFLCKRVYELIPSGSFVLIRVHSNKHSYSNKSHKKNCKFKHFFSKTDFKLLFPLKKYEIIYFSNYTRKFSNREISLFGLENEVITKHSYTLIVKKK